MQHTAADLLGTIDIPRQCSIHCVLIRSIPFYQIRLLFNNADCRTKGALV